MSSEARRVEESRQPGSLWKRWGPYLAERQWATVREDLDYFDRPTPASTKRAARRKA